MSPAFEAEVKRFALYASEQITAHERADHGGQRCVKERANLLGYLAFQLGMDPRMLSRMIGSLLEYRALHASHG